MAFISKTYEAASASETWIPTSGVSEKVIIQVEKKGKTGTLVFYIDGVMSDGSQTGSTALIPVSNSQVAATEVDNYPYLRVVQAGGATLNVSVTEKI